jgi:hypothetical protein
MKALCNRAKLYAFAVNTIHSDITLAEKNFKPGNGNLSLYEYCKSLTATLINFIHYHVKATSFIYHCFL